MRKCQKMLLVLTAAALLPLSAAHAWEDGVYRDQADGFGNGKVIVTVTVREGRLQSLTTENTGGEKSEYYLKAEEALSEAIISANGLEGVDAVSGATGTSESILMAMTGILEQASYAGADADSTSPAVPGADPAAEMPEGTPDDPVSSVKEPTLTPDPKPTI